VLISICKLLQDMFNSTQLNSRLIKMLAWMAKRNTNIKKQLQH